MRRRSPARRYRCSPGPGMAAESISSLSDFGDDRRGMRRNRSRDRRGLPLEKKPNYPEKNWDKDRPNRDRSIGRDRKRGRDDRYGEDPSKRMRNDAFVNRILNFQPNENNQQKKGPSSVSDYRSSFESSSNNNNPDNRLERLEKMVEMLVYKNQDDISVDDSTDDFNPRNTSMWLNRINEECLAHNFDDRECIQYIQSKMTGIIKAWFKTLGLCDYTWPELKMLITRTFPDNVDFAQTLRLLVDRIKAPGETVTQYFFSKMYLLEACKISGAKAVSCLIDGLDNPYWQQEARAHNFLTPETLYSQFLSTLPNHGLQLDSSSAPSVHSRLNFSQSTDAPRKREFFSEDYPSESKRSKCYTCGKPGHIAAECRHAPVCYKCKGKGHIAVKCPKK